VSQFSIAVFDDNPIHETTFRMMFPECDSNVRLKFHEESDELVRFSKPPGLIMINMNNGSRCSSLLLLKILNETPHVPVICYSPEAWCGSKVLKKYAERLVALTYNDIASGLRDYVAELQKPGHERDLYSKNKMTFMSNERVGEKLSPRERDVFCLLGKGHGSLEIAGILNRKKNTVDSHLKSIRRKLNSEESQKIRPTAVQFSQAELCHVFSRYENHICLCRGKSVGTCPLYEYDAE